MILASRLISGVIDREADGNKALTFSFLLAKMKTAVTAQRVSEQSKTANRKGVSGYGIIG